MTADLQTVSSELSRDLSPQWLDLSSRVRHLANETQENPASDSTSALAAEAKRLCDHVERLHSDVGALLDSLNIDGDEISALRGPLETLPTPPAEKIDQANLQIQREMHQKSDIAHVVKALFMWKDDPVHRVRENQD